MKMFILLKVVKIQDQEVNEFYDLVDSAELALTKVLEAQDDGIKLKLIEKEFNVFPVVYPIQYPVSPYPPIQPYYIGDFFDTSLQESDQQFISTTHI